MKRFDSKALGGVKPKNQEKIWVAGETTRGFKPLPA